MSQQDALELFLSHAKLTQPTEAELAVSNEIVSKLGRLALAVEHAAAFVQLHRMPQRYLQQLDAELGSVLEQSPHYTNHKLSVMATYKLTFQAIFETYRQAAYLLTFIGALDGESLPERILRAPSAAPMVKSWCIYDSTDWNYIDNYPKALEMLLTYSLVRLKHLEDGTAAISMHALVHKCVQAKRNQESQWLYLFKASAIILAVTNNEPHHSSTFAQVRWLLKTVKERLHQPITGKPHENIWLTLGHLVFAHRMSWHCAGNMQELNGYAEMIMNSLTVLDRDQDRAMMALMSQIYGMTLQFCHTDKTASEAGFEVLYKQMLPSVSETLRAVHKLIADSSEIISLDFHPPTLEAVYTHVTPPEYVLLLRLVMKSAATFYMGRNQPEIGSLYHRMSQLPAKNTILLRVRQVFSSVSGVLPAFITGPVVQDELCQLQKKAAYDRRAGDMESTLELFRHITSKDMDAPERPDMLFDAALCDYIKLLCKLGRMEEAAAAVTRFQYPSPERSETDIAMSYQEYYLWVRKAFVMANDCHEAHDEVEKQLLETHSVARAVFGIRSINSAHAAFLLQTFYSQSCCHNQAMVQKYGQESKRIFAQFYGGKAKLQRSEGLFMARILLGQGALEEAIYCLETFIELAESAIASDDPILVTARRLAVVAKAEREEELKEVEDGKVSLRWGCISYQRDVSML
jgi:hypothetical protein